MERAVNVLVVELESLVVLCSSGGGIVMMEVVYKSVFTSSSSKAGRSDFVGFSWLSMSLGRLKEHPPKIMAFRIRTRTVHTKNPTT
jgi:hypothetical protein